MHMAGHTDDWSKKNCDPWKFKQLNDVSLSHQVCYLRTPQATLD